ncbi:MAG: hypothetical protein JWQ44_1439 [Chthoniobacter sp.]|jgi:hypothetical protein|nr:hypothetical protein [Chthoniobacter sp.]
MALVVQRSSGAEAGDFANAIGQGGRDISTAIDRDVEAGRVYRYRVYAMRVTPEGPRGTGTSNEIIVRVPER